MWLAASPIHLEEFSKATDLWQSIKGAAAALELEDDRIYRPVSRAQWVLAASMLVAMVIGGLYWLKSASYVTAPGEQKSVLLPDGSRVTLNTATHISIAYDKTSRRISLDRGEALFEARHDPQRPFLVAAGNREIRALGTTFVVRRDFGTETVAVTLVQGQVEVSTIEKNPPHPALLAPGQRFTASVKSNPKIDMPNLEAVTAWRRGEIVFDDVTLAEAARELNRYGGTQVAVGDADVAHLRISGVFAANDPAQFAAAMARIHHLQAKSRGRELLLEK